MYNSRRREEDQKCTKEEGKEAWMYIGWRQSMAWLAFTIFPYSSSKYSNEQQKRQREV